MKHEAEAGAGAKGPGGLWILFRCKEVIEGFLLSSDLGRIRILKKEHQRADCRGI